MSENTMTPFRLMSLPVTVALVLAIAACSKSPEAEPAKAPAAEADHVESGEAGPAEGGEEHGEEGGTAGPVKMDDAALKAAGITLQTLRPSSLSEELRAPGEVVDSAYGTTLITPRVAALVVRRHARLGDEVRAGAPLATLASVEVSDAQADLRIAEQEWRRVSALGREAVAGRRINEAKIAVDRARAKAQAYGLPGSSSGSVNGQFTLSAPHAGRITEDEFVVGERIEPGKALFRLVDESTVWVDATLPSGVVSRRVSRRASVRVPRSPWWRAKPSMRWPWLVARPSSCWRSSSRPSRCSARRASSSCPRRRSRAASGRRSSSATRTARASSSNPQIRYSRAVSVMPPV